MRVTFSLLIAIASAICAVAPGRSAAAVLPPLDHAALRAARLPLAAPVLAPMAFSKFCLRYREDCEIHRLRDAAGVGRARWAEVTRVNAAVNLAIAPREDDGDVVDETWRVAPAAGACHDYAVTKRHELIKLGWPSRALLLAEVVTRWGEHHLVLVVRTRAGDFVADNLYPNVRPWRAAPYRWLRIQSPDNPLYWSTVSADVETADQPSREATPELGADDTLVAADAVEIAAALAERDASQATDSLWALAAPSQRYIFDASLDQGGFGLEGAVALAQPVPSVSPEPPPIVTVAEAADSFWALEAPSQRYVFDASLDQGGFGLEGAVALAQPVPSASSEPPPALIVTDRDAIDPLSLTVSVDFDRDLSPDRSGYGWLVTMD